MACHPWFTASVADALLAVGSTGYGKVIGVGTSFACKRPHVVDNGHSEKYGIISKLLGKVSPGKGGEVKP